MSSHNEPFSGNSLFSVRPGRLRQILASNKSNQTTQEVKNERCLISARQKQCANFRYTLPLRKRQADKHNIKHWDAYSSHRCFRFLFCFCLTIQETRPNGMMNGSWKFSWNNFLLFVLKMLWFNNHPFSSASFLFPLTKPSNRPLQYFLPTRDPKLDCFHFKQDGLWRASDDTREKSERAWLVNPRQWKEQRDRRWLMSANQEKPYKCPGSQDGVSAPLKHD